MPGVGDYLEGDDNYVKGDGVDKESAIGEEFESSST